jgi:hypothetical protein
VDGVGKQQPFAVASSTTRAATSPAPTRWNRNPAGTGITGGLAISRGCTGWLSSSAGYLRARRKRRLLAPVRLPGRAARAFRAGANLAPERAVGVRTWEEFLAERVG